MYIAPRQANDEIDCNTMKLGGPSIASIVRSKTTYEDDRVQVLTWRYYLLARPTSNSKETIHG
jgi:hypothetical protein